MDTDDDTMDAPPPPEYLRMRRRSNTLPTDILRNLKDKHKVKDAKSGPSELTTKLRHYLSVDKASKPRKLPPLERSDSSANSSPGLLRRGKNGLTTPNLVDQNTGSGSQLQNVTGRADKYIDTLIRASSSEGIHVKQRSPLPRGSSVYEALMAEFGHDEEERDILSPLPSPELRRKTKQRHNAHMSHVTQHVTQQDTSDDDSPQPMRRHVHWSQDIKFNKFNKKK